MTYQCVECCKLFATNDNRKRHIKTIHTKEQNYVCDICDKPFGKMTTYKDQSKLFTIKKEIMFVISVINHSVKTLI